MATSVVTEAAAPPPPMNLEARLRRAFHRASGMPPDKELNESERAWFGENTALRLQRRGYLVDECLEPGSMHGARFIERD